MADVFDKGDLVRCENRFKNTAGTLIDPSTVYFRLTPPSGVTVSYQYGVDAALVKSAVGIYHVDVNANASGTWRWRWESTGTGQAAAEGDFIIRRSFF